MTGFLGYFRWPLALTAFGLVGAFLLGLYAEGSLAGGMSFFVICAVLAVLEISLSFDNAIVNANKLKNMSPIWQKRFLTWGILIAVFGMRFIFPLAVVAIAAGIGPLSAVAMAAMEPQRYAHILEGAHLSISAFGGTFLMMVALSYFIDGDKDVHWLYRVEARLSDWSELRGVEMAIVLGFAMMFSLLLPVSDGARFLFAAVSGLLTYLGVEVLGQVLDSSDATRPTAVGGGLGAFLYLQVLDSSFSFDGVIGAFALTQNLFLLAIGLGIGALYVRTMTIMLVERGTLAEFRYLEHGAFYSILALSVIMFTQALMPVPEVVTGLIGAALIGLALWSSIRHNRGAAES